jgi:MFS family permease
MDMRAGRPTPKGMREDSAQRMKAGAPNFRLHPLGLLILTRAGANTAYQMLGVVVSWQIYELTDSALALGMIGLVQFVPPLLLTLVSGHIADQYDRKVIVRWCLIGEAMVAAALGTLSLLDQPPLVLIYLLLLVYGICRTFEGTAVQSLLPSLVPRESLGRAIPTFASANKLSQICGPALGGLLYAFGDGTVAYACCFVLVAVASIACTLLPKIPVPVQNRERTWKTVLAGIDFIWKTKPVFGAMSLDLTVTLLGGVTSLLPIFARDILEIGATGFGFLRSAPAFGGLIIAATFARFPVRRSAGLVMFAGISLYGTATIGFGLSESVALSFLLLLLVGAGDMASTVIRQTLIQLATPDDRRGRVIAVNQLNSQTAAQLGAFQSGLLAEFLGASGSAVLGGVAVFAAVAFWAWNFPALRQVDRPTDLQPD